MDQAYEINLRDFWSIFLKRKGEIAFSLIAVFLAVFIYTNMQTSIYQAQVLLRIDSSAQPSQIIFPGHDVYGYGGRDLEYERSAYSKQLVSSPIIKQAATELGLIKPGLPANK